MTSTRKTETEILTATTRRLSEQGYDVIVEPDPSFLPSTLQRWRPDAIALGRHPKLIVEIVSDRPEAAQRIAELQHALKAEPDWQLHLVLHRTSDEPTLATIKDTDITPVLDRAIDVAEIDARAALMMIWAAFEALSRSRSPEDFARPQSPGRIIERLASEGIIAPSDASFLRSMAQKRNRFVHGDLYQVVAPIEVKTFVSLIRDLLAPVAPSSPRN